MLSLDPRLDTTRTYKFTESTDAKGGKREPTPLSTEDLVKSKLAQNGIEHWTLLERAIASRLNALLSHITCL